MINRRVAASIGAMTVLTLFSAAALATDLTGKWSGTITDPGGIGHELTLTLKSEGDKVTGSVMGGPPNGEKQRISNGKLEGDQLTFVIKTLGPQGEAVNLPYSGKVSGDRIVGTIGPMAGPTGTEISAPWEVTKK
jgi:hypothetical protein